MLGTRKVLTLKLIMMVVATSTIMTTLSSLVQIGFEYQQESSQLGSSLQAIEKTGIESIQSLVWTVDYPAITRQIDSILLIQEVVKIRVLDENGVVIAEKSKDEHNFERITHMEFKFIKGESKYFGKADLFYTTDYLISHLKRRIVTIIITNFVKTSLVSMVLMFLFSYFVVNPITTLADSFDRTLWQDLSKIRRVKLSKRGKRDEIDALCEGVNETFSLIEAATKSNRSLIAEQRSEIVLQNANTLEAIQKVDEAEERLRAEQAANADARRRAMVGILAQGMAHEVNNPLTIIKGQVWRIERLLEQDKSTIDRDEVQKRLANLQKAIARISTVIGSLKKLGASGDSSGIKVMSVEELFEDVKNLMTSVCSQNQVALTVELGNAKNFLIKVCESEMVQVLVNLVNNSLEAIETLPDPVKWIKLNAEVFEQGDFECIYLKVSDCGPGISADVAQKIFLPFFTTKSVGKGMGLGLSVVHQLVTDYGGQIYINPDVKNTEFVIKLPKAA